MPAKSRKRRRLEQAQRHAAVAPFGVAASAAALAVLPAQEAAAPGDYEWEIERLNAAVPEQTGRR